jgi:ferredoxin
MVQGRQEQKGTLPGQKEGLSMRVIVDEETCIGCGLCAETCPEVFEMTDDKAKVKGDEVPKNVTGSCKEAVENCPVEAIRIEE